MTEVRVRMRNSLRPDEFVVDDGVETNGRTVLSVKTSGKMEVFTDGQWLIFRDAYLSFVGNHAIIHPGPNLVTKALRERPTVDMGVDDGS